MSFFGGAVLVVLSVSVFCSAEHTHWIATRSNRISPATDIPFRSSIRSSDHLGAFLFHSRRVSRYREFGEKIHEFLFFNESSFYVFLADVPDALSKNIDYEDDWKLSNLDFSVPLGILPSFRGIDIRRQIDLSNVPKKFYGKEPVCEPGFVMSFKEYPYIRKLSRYFSLAGYMETKLLALIWFELSKDDTSLPPSDFEMRLMGALTSQISQGARTWAPYFVASLYWRTRGSTLNCLQCLLYTLNFCPPSLRDIPFASMAAVLYSVNKLSDALILVDKALEVNVKSYSSHILRGFILLRSNHYPAAATSFAKAVQCDREMTAGYEYLLATLSDMKRQAAAVRQDREYNFRRLTMVLPNNTTWDEFYLDGPEESCRYKLCPTSSACSAVDGQCHCISGYTPVNGTCILDKTCDSVHCKANSYCRDGKCHCDPGFFEKDGKCIRDLCADILCVEHATCDRTLKLCKCDPPFVQYGTKCVTPNCVGVDCWEHAFCHHGKCFCRIGYQRVNDSCVKEELCQQAICPSNANCSEVDGHCRCNPDYIVDFSSNKCVPSSKGSLAPPVASLANDNITSNQIDSIPEDHTKAPSEPVEDSFKEPSIKTNTVKHEIRDDLQKAEGASLKPNLGIGVQPGKTIDVGRDKNVPLPFEKENFITELVCTPEMRRLPKWFEFPRMESLHWFTFYRLLDSTFLPPDAGNHGDIRVLLFGSSITPSSFGILRKPFCGGSDPLFSAGTMDHIPSLAFDTVSKKLAHLKYPIETGLNNMGKHLFGDELDQNQFGHIVAVSVKKYPGMFTRCSCYFIQVWSLYDLATMFWRSLGDQLQALTCVRKSLYFAPLSHKDVPLLAAAGILLRLNQLEDAQTVAEVALKVTRYHKAICHFTLGNIYFAQNRLEFAIKNYKAALNFQPAFSIASKALKRVMCAMEYPLDDSDGADKVYFKEENNVDMQQLQMLQFRLDDIRGLIEQQSDRQAIESLKKQFVTAQKQLTEVFRQKQIGLAYSTSSSFPYVSMQKSEQSKEQQTGSNYTTYQLLDPSRIMHAPEYPITLLIESVKEILTNSISSTVQQFSMEFTDSSFLALLVILDVKVFADPLWPGATKCAGHLQVDVTSLNFLKALQIESAIAGLHNAFDLPGDAEFYFDFHVLTNFVEDELWLELETLLASSCRPGNHITTWLADDEDIFVNRINLQRNLPGKKKFRGFRQKRLPLCAKLLPVNKTDLDVIPSVAMREKFTFPIPQEHDIVDLIASTSGIDELSLDDFGTRLQIWMSGVKGLWDLPYLASFYWRGVGNATEAIECLRAAYWMAPPSRRINVLTSLANVLNAADKTRDALRVAKSAFLLDPTNDTTLLTLANVLDRYGQRTREETLFFYEASIKVNNGTYAPLLRIEHLRCFENTEILPTVRCPGRVGGFPFGCVLMWLGFDREEWLGGGVADEGAMM
eukprot:gene521-3847_t